MSSKKTKTSSKAVKTNTSNAKGVKVAKDRTVGAHVPASQQCEHKSAKHHSRGKCVSCYNAKKTKSAAIRPARLLLHEQRRTFSRFATEPTLSSVGLFMLIINAPEPPRRDRFDLGLLRWALPEKQIYQSSVWHQTDNALTNVLMSGVRRAPVVPTRRLYAFRSGRIQLCDLQQACRS